MNKKEGLDYPNQAQEKQKCLEFLQNYSDDGSRSFKYMDQLQEIADRDRLVLEIFIDDILRFKNDDLFAQLIQVNAIRFIHYFEEIADDLMPSPRNPRIQSDIFDILRSHRSLNDTNQGVLNPQVPRALTRRFEVSLVPLESDRPRKLRDIKATDIGHLIFTTGMVSRASEVKPHVSICTYTCDVCEAEIFQEITGYQFMPLVRCSSERCKDNKSAGRVHMQSRGSRFMKYQELRVQELPDQVPVGNIPRTITVQCRGEQTRKCGPGDIIRLSGILMTVKYNGYKAITAGLQADTYILATNIEKQKLSYEDLANQNSTHSNALIVREIASSPDPYSLLARSIAPEIFGHEDIKKALLLQLVGGVTRVLSDGVKIRGDLNICLMGDPGVAKSQLLKYIATLAPRGVYTTGKGSSGVGLTAAVVRDTISGEMALEGGALVLADMGICCIDEFDKMDENDRTAIHEVMEQQTVSSKSFLSPV